MKGFFSARGQGIRTTNPGQFEKSPTTQTAASQDLGSKHPTRGNQLVNSQQNGQIQGMFSPRRNIMSG